MNLAKRLKIWVDQGLIEAKHAEAIQAYEKAAPQTPWALYGVAGIGVTALATGVISLIAANWDAIPASVKLVVYFLLEGALGALVVRQAARPGLRREVYLTLFMLLVLAGIGLVAQVFHLHSNGWGGLLFWLALTLPVTLLAQSRLLGHMWLGGAAVMLAIWVGAGNGRLQAAVTAGYVAVAIGFAHLHGLKINEWFRKAALDWGMTFVVAGLSVAASLFWIEEVPREMRRHLYLPWIGCALAAAVIAWSSPPYQNGRRWRWATVATLVAATAYFTLPALWKMGHRPIASAAFFLVVWSLAGLAAAAADRRRLFDVISFVIAARFVVIYFEVLGGLAATGIGLIFSGGVILGVTAFWYRSRQRLAALAAGGR